MQKFICVFICLFLSAAAYSMDTPRTAMIGGVDLFDVDSPLVGIQNPALLYDYGRIQPAGTLLTNSTASIITNVRTLAIPVTNSVSITNKAKKKNPVIRVTNIVVLSNAVVTNFISTNVISVKEAPIEYHVGRFFLLNPYFSMGASGDLLSSFQYYTAMFRGQLGGLQPSQADAIRTAVLILSFGMIDLRPLFETNRATSYEIVSNLIQASQSRSGFYGGMNLNLLSFNRDRVGVAVLMESEMYGGTVSPNHDIFFMVNDPVFRMQYRVGAAVSVSPGSFDLPLFGNTAVGFTVRIYPSMLEAKVESFADYFTLFDQMQTYATNGLDASAFGDGRLVRVGMGLSGDIALLKRVNPDFEVAFKLNDVISPRYWLNSRNFGWVLPDLSVGMKYVFPIGGTLKYFVNKPSLYFQMDDLLYTQPKTLLAKVKLGADVSLLLDIFQIGAGINAGYPTLGLALHIPIFFIHLKAYASLYGKEFGYFPGDFGFQGYTFGTEFYLGF